MPPNLFFKRCWICLSFERLTQSETMSVVDMLESSLYFQYSIVHIPKLLATFSSFFGARSHIILAWHPSVWNASFQLLNSLFACLGNTLCGNCRIKCVSGEFYLLCKLLIRRVINHWQLCYWRLSCICQILSLTQRHNDGQQQNCHSTPPCLEMMSELHCTKSQNPGGKTRPGLWQTLGSYSPWPAPHVCYSWQKSQ